MLNDHATFVSGAGVGLTNFNREPPFRPKSLILEADPPQHTQMRAILSRILSPKTVMQIRATFAAEVEALVERCVAKGAIDGIGDLAQPYPLKVFPDAVGFVPPHELGPYYERAAVVVVPSRREGYGMVAREAMAHGRPVVATAVGGLLDVVEDGVTGILVPPGDIAALQRDGQRECLDRCAARETGGFKARQKARMQIEGRKGNVG